MAPTVDREAVEALQDDLAPGMLPRVAEAVDAVVLGRHPDKAVAVLEQAEDVVVRE